MSLRNIAEHALARIASEMIAEAPDFIRAGMKHPRWSDIRRIERRFNCVGCGDSLLDSQWTRERQHAARALLRAFPWDGTECREQARRTWASDATRPHYFPA